MEPAEREDFLLAVSRLQSRTGRRPLVGDIAVFLQKSEPEVQNTILSLVVSREIEIDTDGGGVRLTSSGEAAATGVMKKHKVLETFFEEMLGMDRSAAHHEACTLEHHTSEEAITRLKRFIRSKDPSLEDSMNTPQSEECRILSECEEGVRICIKAVKGCGRVERLADLGLIPGEEVLIKRKMAKTVLIQVKGCDIAISADIAKMILVEICR